MEKIDAVIIALLKNSTLPGFYKTLIKNMLPGMIKSQKVEIFMTLDKEHDAVGGLDRKKTDLVSKYEYILDRLENDPDEYMHEMDRFENKMVKEDTKSKSSSSMSALKQKVDLEELKKQLQK
ncbi:hypothetical protein HOG17_03300 [Candidatus Peregrinibacteria bacterium]|jgi:hypothetical protein|nr:hypothetical protein [Candidatus Peregrinibacteria bacterium]MBT4148232.1 hypothetical protein [Candidatus Peregrinibacteria bacterium]MBT4455870.1 hypothetical protein [Candidatus Peregrinibacteria bacterium]